MTDLRIHDLRRTLGSWQAKTGASLAIVAQLRGLQASFDLLTAVYVEFNKDLTVAYRQSTRIATYMSLVNERRVEAQRPLSPAEEANFTEALEARQVQIQQARAVLDSAFANPERIGGDVAITPLRALQATITRLEELVGQTAAQSPAEVIVDVRTQHAINEQDRKSVV